jgi:GMP synthase-like glutamine amidotransferase
METSTNEENKFEILSHKDLNIYENVHLFFYTTNENGEIHLLLNSKNGGKYQEFNTEILPTDNLPTFAISRLMATTYRGLFSSANMKKLSANETLTSDDILPTDEFKWYSIWNNEIFADWLNIISDNPIQYDLYKSTMIYFLPLPQINLESLNKNLENLNYPFKFYFFKYDYSFINNISPEEYQLELSTHNLMKKFDFKSYINETIKMFSEDNVDHYVIIACKKAGSKKDQAGFFHFPALIPGIYRKNNEKWTYLVSSTDPLPDENFLSKIKAIIIPGSELNIYMDLDFLRKTEEFVKNLLVKNPEVKFLGLCFGLQVLVSALGGKVEKMGEDIFVARGEQINFTDDFWNFNFVKQSGVQKGDGSLVIRQAHGDHTTLLPDYDTHKIKNYASSESCNVELLLSDNGNVFCVQGHPEYANEFSMARAAQFWCLRSKMEPTPENMIIMKEKMISMEKYPHVHCTELRKLCNSFLKN